MGFVLFAGGLQTAPQRAMVSKSERTDGQWITAPGFPAALSDDSVETFPDPLGVSLPDGDVCWVWDPDGDARILGQVWHPDGTREAREQVSVGAHRHGLFNLVADGADVHVVYGGGFAYYRRRTAGRFGPQVTVSGSAGGHTALTLLNPGHVAVSWLDLTHQRIVEREVRDEVPGQAQLLFDASNRKISGRLQINLNALPRAAGPFHSAVAATVGAEAPFDVVLLTRPP